MTGLVPADAGWRNDGATDTTDRSLRRSPWVQMLLATALLAVALLAVAPRPAVAAASSHPRVAADVPVTPEDLVNRTSNNSPLLAADPTNRRFVVLANRIDGPDFGCALQVSGDGGRTWLSADPVPRLPQGAEKCYGPEVAFDRQGRLYYLFLGLHGVGNSPMGAFLTTSDDRARTFTAPRLLLGAERYQVRMAVDPTLGRHGRLHLVWLETSSPPPLGGLPPGDNPIMAAHSDDGGRTFSRPVRVSDPERQRAVAPALTVGTTGRRHRVQVVYYDLNDDARDYQGLEGPPWDGRWSLVATTSTDGGNGFSHGVVVDAGLVPPERVMLVYTMPPPSLVSDRQGRLYTAWYDARNGDWDVFLSRSGDGGRSWSAPVRLNDDAIGDGKHQYLPRLAVAPDGRLDAMFYDRRGSRDNRGNDVYLTWSSDHGVHFAPNLKLNSLDFDSKIGPRYDVPSAEGLNEFGSRLALLSTRSGVVGAWTDTRNTGRAFPAQDIFATSVELAPS